MAYQNVVTPKFYINSLEWLQSNGSLPVPVAGSGNTSMQENFSFRTIATPKQQFEKIKWLNNFPKYLFKQNTDRCESFIAVLSHTLKTNGTHLTVRHANNQQSNVDFTPIVNAGAGGVELEPEFNGWSLASFQFPSDNDFFRVSFSSNSSIGSIICGTSYKMPTSAQLNLKMTNELDGIETSKTKAGFDIVNYKYTKPIKWGNLAPWEIGSSSPELSRIGRRSWDLNFSYISDSNIFPDVSSLSNYGTNGWSNNQNATNNTLLYDDSFFGQVIHRTNGGQLPFIFQPDSSNNNPQNFAICKFDQNSFDFKQVANGVYDISLKIREIW
tara:strand:+ start:16885 stop:17865 length:981 start_codon:yes stop_codon:yes gene_type:complete